MLQPASLSEIHIFILEYLSWRIDQELIAANLIKPREPNQVIQIVRK